MFLASVVAIASAPSPRPVLLPLPTTGLWWAASPSRSCAPRTPTRATVPPPSAPPSQSLANVVKYALRRLSSLDTTVYPIGRVLGNGLAIGRDVAVRAAGSKGQGVFATRVLPPGTLIGWYTGEVLSNAEYLRRREAGLTTGDYAIALGASWTIDADDAETSSWLRYINHSSRRANAASFYAPPRRGLEARHGATFFEVTKRVAVGEELLVDYGQDYWLFRYPAGPLDPRWWAVELS